MKYQVLFSLKKNEKVFIQYMSSAAVVTGALGLTGTFTAGLTDFSSCQMAQLGFELLPSGTFLHHNQVALTIQPRCLYNYRK